MASVLAADVVHTLAMSFVYVFKFECDGDQVKRITEYAN
jgi:hypothetical protein